VAGVTGTSVVHTDGAPPAAAPHLPSAAETQTVPRDGDPEPPSLWALIGPFIAILCLAAVLRGYALTSNPPGYFEDELSGAVSAWSVVTTGHDVGHTLLPFVVTRLEVKQPLYFYATVPFQAVLGPGPLAGRLPAVLFGVVSTALVVWLGARLTRSAYVGLVAGALFAVSPWAVHYGRAGWEPASVLPLTVGGIGLLWTGLEDHRRGRIVAGAAVLAIGAYTYHPALLMNVVLAGIVVAIQVRRLQRRDLVALVAGGVLALVILVPYGLAATDPLFLGRTRNISVFKDGLTAEALQEAWRNYWSTWNPSFLLAGVGPTPRINPGPLVMITTVPLILAGLDRAVHRRSRADWLLLAWLVAGALPAAVTSDLTVPSAARALFMVPPLVILGGMGAIRIADRISRALPPNRREIGLRMLAVGAAWLLLFDVWAWSQPYFVDYPAESAYSWKCCTESGFRLVRDQVPDGGTVCIGDIPFFTYPQHLVLYLPDPPFTTIEGTDHDACRVPGTYVLARVAHDLGVPVTEIARARGVGVPGNDYHLVRVDGG
jgi:4-amino-4-deoxy-L-arabinose transferase-like glycosyltransferase